MGEINNPTGDAIAWAESSARHDAEKLETRIVQLERVVQVLENRLNAIDHRVGMLALHELANEPDDVRATVELLLAARAVYQHYAVDLGHCVTRDDEPVLAALAAALRVFEGK